MGLTAAAIGTIVSAAIGAAGNLTSTGISAGSSKKARNWSSEENEKNRIFNNEQASKAYQRQLEFWNMENEYNTPSNQIKRLKEAGLNPDLAYQGLSANASSGLSSVPQASAGGSAPVPATFDTSGLQNFSLNAAQVAKTLSEVRKTNAETDNYIADTLLKTIKAQYDPTLYSQLIETNNVTISLKQSARVVNEKQANYVEQLTLNAVQEGKNLMAKYDEIRANVALLNEKEQTEVFNRMMRSKEFDLEVKKFYEQVRRNNAAIELDLVKAREIASLMVAKAFNLEAQTNYFKAQTGLVNTQRWSEFLKQRGIELTNDRLQIGLQIDKEVLSMKETQNNYQVTSLILDFFSRLLGMLAQFVPGSSQVPPSPVTMGETSTPGYVSSPSY